MLYHSLGDLSFILVHAYCDILFDFHYIVGLSVRVGLNQTLELSEMTRQQLEEEIQALNHEKGDIQEQLSSVSKQTSISRTHCNIIIMTFSKRANIIKTWMKSLNYYRIHYDDKFLKKKTTKLHWKHELCH